MSEMADHWCFQKKLHEKFDKFVRRFFFSIFFAWTCMYITVNEFNQNLKIFQNGVSQEYKPRVVSTIRFFWKIQETAHIRSHFKNVFWKWIFTELYCRTAEPHRKVWAYISQKFEDFPFDAYETDFLLNMWLPTDTVIIFQTYRICRIPRTIIILHFLKWLIEIVISVTVYLIVFELTRYRIALWVNLSSLCSKF